MGILGIENRTENWKTARTFAPFFENDDSRVRLINRIVCNHGDIPSKDLLPGDVRLELYWKPIRDWLSHKGVDDKDWECKIRAAAIRQLECLGVRSNLASFICERQCNDQRIKSLKATAYCVEKKDPTDNLKGTEIDIVLETDGYLCIGEAKQESSFSNDTNLALTHQLIRQYVTAKVLVDIAKSNHKVIPFVVVTKKEKLKSGGFRPFQLDFMIDQEWMSKSNIFSWCDINQIARQSRTAG